MGSITPIGCTQMGDYVIDRDLDHADRMRLKEDEIDAEACEALTYQDWLEQMAEMDEEKQKKFMDAIKRGDTFSRWVIECATSGAYDNARMLKFKEITAKLYPIDDSSEPPCDTH